ncbi:transcriptional regulator [Arthrobacter sp. MYb227]|uniref:winged helix-turn-helix domain-containing protein n=1 Tax=Arthrobacter sp. MYb227 TaxID=1848601 RepID=UPI000CFDE072|nr:response regulator transcription factor [Arthrobacter sp. MYb227]PQZ96139.1 transcriptional regulator [Arthrobacter sp. MYb227]
MASILLLSNAPAHSPAALPALELLSHQVRTLPAHSAALLEAEGAALILVDGRNDLVASRTLCQLLRSTGTSCPVVLVLTEGGMAAVSASWQVDDVLLESAGPAEIEARFRLAMGRTAPAAEPESVPIRAAGVVIDEASYTAKVHGSPLNLTYKEFELLKYLVQHPGRVFSREQLLHEVWGYDYYGGTRTVDVHVRRLRAKLGTDHEQLIGTVRNVGYRFTPIRHENTEVIDA